MRSPGQVNVSEVIGNSSFGGFQLGLCVLCGLCLIMDGFDVQAMGYVAPAILQEWHVSNALFGPVFGAGLFGILVGSLVFSMVADKIGRRPVLIAVTLCFSVLTFLTARAADVEQMLVIRFLAGTALGGIMPNAVALVGEYSPRKLRVTIMMIVGNGFTTGAASGGFIARWLIPSFGWRSVFYFGAAAPLAIAAIMIFALPESLQFLVLHRKHLERAVRWLKRIDPSASEDPRLYYVEETQRKGVPWIHLFHEGRGIGTTFLWIINESAEPLFPGELAADGGQSGRICDWDIGAGGNHGAAGRNDRRAHPWLLGPTMGLRWSTDYLLYGRVHQYCAHRAAWIIAGDVICSGVFRWIWRGRRPNRNQCTVGNVLPDRLASHRNRRRTRCW